MCILLYWSVRIFKTLLINGICKKKNQKLIKFIFHIFSGKYSSFEYLIKCQMPTLYHTPTLYTLLFKYMIKCIKHGKIRIICRIALDQYHPSGLKALG